MTRVIAVSNQKGGTGKTTTTVNLAAELAAMGQRVLVVDLDGSGNATAWLGGERVGGELLQAWVDRDLGRFVSSTTIDGVSLIPASLLFAHASQFFAGKVGAETKLRVALDELRDAYDFILLDGSPTLAFVTVSGLIAADELLLPVEARAMPLEGVRDMMNLLDEVRGLNPQLRVLGIVPVRFNGSTRLAKTVVEQLRAAYGEQVTQSVVRESVAVAEAPAHRLPIREHDPKGNGAADYRALAMEVTR